ncbi:carbohydrate ABC transporter permease [Kitasatospora sp. NPDC087314]|uniref:carbohydrate ABC transporter permease n=1 Tax=Kitasatospora sp. NPDC087314 TaxID=3364068 RepID=UPI003822E149
MRTKHRAAGPAMRIARAVVWVVVAADLLLILWVFLTSLRGSNDIFAHPFGLPTDPQPGNYGRALNEGGFGRAALNSVLVATVSSVAAVALAAPAAYVLARRRTRTSSALTMTFAMGLGVPGQVLVVPLFIGLAQVDLTDSLFGLILVYVGLAMPFTVYLLTGFFSGVPAVLEEAATLDGAGPLRTFLQVIVPVARGGLITAFLLQVIGAWNETLFALVLNHSENKITLPVSLADFVATEQLNGMDWGTMFAGVCLILAPMLALFSWLGTRIIQGMTVGIGK